VRARRSFGAALSPVKEIKRRENGMKVFVSYRREDSQHVVPRLCARLDQAFGPRNVFYDERSINTGGDFLGAVGGAIYTSDVILVVIGPQWMAIRDARGRLRLDDDDDPVGWEVGLGLASGRMLIPLLVDGAGMPSKNELPRKFRDLTTRSGFRLPYGAGFDAAVDDLIERLGGPRPQAPPQGSRAPRGTASWTSFEGYWQTRDGGMTEILQNGNAVELNGSDTSGVHYAGIGQIQGGFAILNFSNSHGLQGRLVMQLVQNGAYINGQVQTVMGVVPFEMMRRT
jgi:TIR domain-containing protein